MSDTSVPPQPQSEKRTRSRLGFWLLVLTAAMVAAGMIILALLPYAMEWGGERALLKLGAASATIEDVDFNPMTGRLILTDLKFQGINGDGASVEHLLIKIDLFPLLKKRIYIRTLDLLGVNIEIRQSAGGELDMGGIVLPSSPAEEKLEPSGDSASLWGMGIRDLDVREISFRFINPEIDETVGLDRLNLKRFSTWEPDRASSFSVRAIVLDAGIELEGEMNPLSTSPTVKCELNLRNLSLERLLPYLADYGVTTLSGTVLARGKLEGTIVATAPSVDFELAVDGSEIAAVAALNMEDPEVSRENVSVKLGQASLKAAGTFARAGSPGTNNVGLTSEVVLSKLVLGAGNSPAALLKVGTLKVDSITVDGPEKLAVSNVSVEKVQLLDRPAGSVEEKQPREVASLGNISVDGITVEKMSRIGIDAIRMDTLNAWIQRKEGGALEAMEILSASLPHGSDTLKQSGGGSTSSSGPGMSAAVGIFSLTGENRIVFRDLDVQPPFQTEIDSLSVQVLDLDTGKDAGPATVAVKAGMGKYSSVSLDATVNPPWDKPDLNIHTRLAAIDLPQLTPYTNRYLGYILKSGHLDLDLDTVVERGNITAQAEVLVNRIEMDPVKEEDAQRAEDRLGIPVNTALSLLKDKNDDIELTLPIEGNLDDPEFKATDIVLTATGNALKKGVTAYYGDLGATLLTGGLIPPGTFSFLGALFSGATTMSFEPVLFDPLDEILSTESEEYLGQLAGKLSEKPGVRLVLCGKVTHADIAALRQKAFDAAISAAGMEGPASTVLDENDTKPASDVVEDQPLPAEAGTTPATVNTGPLSVEDLPLTDEEKEVLIEMAKQRALAVKGFLTEKGGLDPDRLFVCYSDVEKEEGGLPPRVDLSI
jgi:hypothetical protein